MVLPSADILRIARKYFIEENRLVVRYTSGPAEQGGASHASAAPREAPNAAAPVETPPQPAAPRRVMFPKPAEKTLANGLRVIVIPRPGTGLVTVNAEVRAGSVNDPADAAGLADFTAQLVTRGTRTRSAAQIADSAEELGGSIRSNSGWDSSSVVLSALSSRLAEAMPLFADVLQNPAFAPEEQEKLRTENLDGLTVSLRAPGTLARYAAARVVFGDSAYGHQLGGTPESLHAIQAAAVPEFYRANYGPRRTVLIFGGDITPAAAFAFAEQHFQGWSGGSSASSPPAITPSRGGRILVVDKPDAGQAAVLLVSPGLRRADPDYEIARVANSVLGEGYSARLNQEIRVKRGLSYGAGSQFDLRRDGGMFIASAQTRNDAVPEVASLLEAQMKRMPIEMVQDAELVPRKAALSGSYSRSLETVAGLTGAVASLANYDLPLTTLNRYLPAVQSVTATQVKTFAEHHLDMSQASIVIVGDGRQFLAALRQKYPNTEVISAADLDLNRGSLRKP